MNGQPYYVYPRTNGTDICYYSILSETNVENSSCKLFDIQGTGIAVDTSTPSGYSDCGCDPGYNEEGESCVFDNVVVNPGAPATTGRTDLYVLDYMSWIKPYHPTLGPKAMSSTFNHGQEGIEGTLDFWYAWYVNQFNFNLYDSLPDDYIFDAGFTAGDLGGWWHSFVRTPGNNSVPSSSITIFIGVQSNTDVNYHCYNVPPPNYTILYGSFCLAKMNLTLADPDVEPNDPPAPNPEDAPISQPIPGSDSGGGDSGDFSSVVAAIENSSTANDLVTQNSAESITDAIDNSISALGEIKNAIDNLADGESDGGSSDVVDELKKQTGILEGQGLVIGPSGSFSDEDVNQRALKKQELKDTWNQIKNEISSSFSVSLSGSGTIDEHVINVYGVDVDLSWYKWTSQLGGIGNILVMVSTFLGLAIVLGGKSS